MRRLGVFGLLLAAIALLAVATVFWFAKSDLPPLPLCLDANQQDPPEAADLFFREEGRAYVIGFRGEGKFTTSHVWDYTSEDEISLQLYFDRYPSERLASEGLSEMVRKAVEVVERGPRFDSKGERIGEKAVLKRRGRKSGGDQAVVAWTDVSWIWVVQSSSLRHSLLLYEQSFGQPDRMSIGDMHVEWAAGGEVRREGTLEAYTQCFRFEDGVVVKRTIAEYEFLAHVDAEMRRAVIEAVKVLIRRPVEEENVPQWVLLRMPASGPREAQAVLVRSYGGRIVIHESSSFRHALWGLYFEFSDPGVPEQSDKTVRSARSSSLPDRGSVVTQSSKVYIDAMKLVRAAPVLKVELGRPVKAGSIVWGRSVEQGESGYAEFTTAISGPRAKGEIHAVANLAQGKWRFASLVLSLPGAGQRYDLSPPPPPETLPLNGRGRVYLVPLGAVESVQLEGLPEYYRQRFGLEVTLLPSLSIDASVENPKRRQAVAERLIGGMRAAHPQLSDDPKAFLIGVTEKDMYIDAYQWKYAFGLREEGRFAVISTARFNTRSYLGGLNPEIAQVRLRKFLTKNIGIMYYRLDLSLDPTSVLYGDIGPASDFDLMSEEFLGADGVWNPWRQQSMPCITVTRHPRGGFAWRFSCAHSPPRDLRYESFVVVVDNGLFVQRQTDFYFEDEPLPLAFVRMYRPQDKRSRAFGLATNHSLDIFLVGDAPKLTYVELILEDGARIHFRRVSPGTGHRNARFAAAYSSDNPFSGSRLKWNGQGWDLERRDGWTFVFPASYGVARSQQAALVGIRDSEGHEFKLERDSDGNLLRVLTPNGNLLRFEYDSSQRVSRAWDNRGRVVHYEYDSLGRLRRVEDSSGRISNYSYDSKHQMLTVSDGTGRPFLTNEYDEDGYAIRQALGDGSQLQYRYLAKAGDDVLDFEFVDPQGFVTRAQRDGKLCWRSVPAPRERTRGNP
jgi:YD repeat-containing protein